MNSNLKTLETRIAGSTGKDRELDRLVAAMLAGAAGGTPAADYSSSVDECIALIAAILPGWDWHVGHGPDGILPYAALSRKEGPQNTAQIRVEAAASTVPLALLHATVKAVTADRGR